MKSEERHELKTNELSEWILNFPEWAKENTGTIAYVVVLIIIVGVVGYLKWYRPATSVSREQIELSQLAGQLEMAKFSMVSSKSQSTETIRGIGDRLDAIASQLSNPENAAFALIKRGDALRAELHFGSADFAKDPNALEFQINKAKGCYQQAIEKAGTNNQLAAAAQFGLGLCEEEVGNFEQAQKTYHEIATNEKYVGTVLVPMARDRAADMSDYKGNFVFVETPPKLTAPAAAPAAPSMPLGPRIDALPKAQAPVVAPVKPVEANSAPKK